MLSTAPKRVTMALLTLFSIPRAFSGDVGDRQLNAIRSWSRLGPDVEVLLYGDDPGVADAASSIGARHEPTIATSSYGTPLLREAFLDTAENSSTRLLCYVNADIILLPDFLTAVRRIRLRRFLMVGQRHDLDVDGLIDFEAGDVGERLLDRVERLGSLHQPAGSDYFVYPRETPWDCPPLVIGRGRWDNWIIYRARALGLRVVDATDVTRVIHQNHDYAHIAAREDPFWEGPEAQLNRRLIPDSQVFTLLDATHRLTPQRLEPTREPSYYMRRRDTWPLLRPRSWILFRAADKLSFDLRNRLRSTA